MYYVEQKKKVWSHKRMRVRVTTRSGAIHHVARIVLAIHHSTAIVIHLRGTMLVHRTVGSIAAGRRAGRHFITTRCEKQEQAKQTVTGSSPPIRALGRQSHC
jgi:hypothetical protein